MKKQRFGLIGSGWRAEFYIRIAKLLPEQLELTGVVIRDSDKGATFAKKFSVPVVQTLDELLEDRPDFVVLSINRDFVTDYLVRLFERKVPVLCETPPGKTVADLEELWESSQAHGANIQVAEQYFLQPLYAAWLQVMEEGRLGEVENMSISALHGYHAVSMIRKMLNVPYERCVIHGKRFSFRVTETADRGGFVADGEVMTRDRDRLTFEFENGKTAFFDFSGVQYHSYIRTRQLNVQGTRGEIDDLTVRYLAEDGTPVTQELQRIDLGVYNNQEWAHQGIMLGERYVYKSPFPTGRLNDDEIAIADCLFRMGHYVQTGESFYSLREALQDTYVSIKMEEALSRPNEEIVVDRMIWAE